MLTLCVVNQQACLSTKRLVFVNKTPCTSKHYYHILFHLHVLDIHIQIKGYNKVIFAYYGHLGSTYICHDYQGVLSVNMIKHHLESCLVCNTQVSIFQVF